MHLFSQDKITKMESERFILNLKDPKLVAIVSGSIGQTASGSPSHLAGALKLGLEKCKRQCKGALLQCPVSGCTRNANPVSRSFVEPNLSCPRCTDYQVSYSIPMLCASCEYWWNSGDTSCQNCRKRFL